MINCFKKKLHSFIDDGQTVAEYGLIALLFSLATIAILPSVGHSVLTLFNVINSAIPAV